MNRLMVIIALGLASLTNNFAEAGVRGNRFEGTQRYVLGGSYSTVTDFYENFSFVESADFGEGPIPYPGVYEEIDLGIISVWSCIYDDFPGEFTVYGVSLFSRISTYFTLDLVDGEETAFGIVHRTGPAQIPE